MKLSFLILSIILTFNTLSSQAQESYIIRSNFGYNYKNNDALDVSDINSYIVYGEKMHDLNLCVNFGKMVGSNFMIGVGLNYKNLKTIINDEIPRQSNSTGSITSTYIYSTSIDKTISPLIFAGYITKLSNKFTANIDLTFRYGFSKEMYEATRMEPSTSNAYVPGDSYENLTEIQRLEISLNPSIRFQVIKNGGFELIFGGFNYGQKLKDSRNPQLDLKTKEFEVQFNPQNWLFGFFYNI